MRLVLILLVGQQALLFYGGTELPVGSCGILHGRPVTIRRRRQGEVRFEPITPGGDRIAVIAAPSDI
jgi:hypothetical protein